MARLMAVMCAVCIAGCATGTGKPDIERVARLVGSATLIGTQAYLIGHPQARTAFVASRAALRTLQADGNYDPLAFAAAFQNLPISGLQGEYGALYISVALVAWDELRAEAIALDRPDWVKPVLDAAIVGFDRALGP